MTSIDSHLTKYVSMVFKLITAVFYGKMTSYKKLPRKKFYFGNFSLATDKMTLVTKTLFIILDPWCSAPLALPCKLANELLFSGLKNPEELEFYGNVD